MLSKINSLQEKPSTLCNAANFKQSDYLTHYTNSDGSKSYYLEVKYRILWFRLCYPLGRIETIVLQHDNNSVLV